MKRRNRSDEGGFTLVELMVAVAIIGLLATIALERFDSQRARTRQSEAKVNLAALAVAESAYYASNNSYTNDLTQAAFSPERGNRYAYYIDSPPTEIQTRSTPKTVSVPGTDEIAVDTAMYPSLAASPAEFSTDGTITFAANASKTVIPSASVTYFLKGATGAYLARAFGVINNNNAGTADAWFVSSNTGTVTSGCRSTNGARVMAGSPGMTYDQAQCL